MAFARYTPPTNPLQFLEKYFIDYPQEKNKIIAASKAKLSQGDTYRVFDDFPILLSSFEHQSQVSLLRHILNDINKHELDDEKVMRMLSPWNQQQLKMNIIKMALQGYEGLITSGKPKPELVKLLHWEEYKNKIDVRALLSAYVGSIFNDIHFQLKKSCPDQDQQGIDAIAHYINKNYHQWVIEAINRAENKPSATPVPSTRPNSHRTRNTVAAGGAALAVLAGGALLFFADNSRRREQDRDPYNQFRRRH